MVLVSFDIDGTLEVGDPPGVIGLEVVRRAKALGFVVGSASDRVLSDQRDIWQRNEIEMDFVAHKHRLDQVRERFESVTRWIHIGDTHVDRHFAGQFGFEFFFPDELPDRGVDAWVLTKP